MIKHADAPKGIEAISMQRQSSRWQESSDSTGNKMLSAHLAVFRVSLMLTALMDMHARHNEAQR